MSDLNQKIFFVSYGNENFKNSLTRIEKEARQMNIFSDIFTYNFEKLDSDFTEKHKEFITKNKKGGGYWIWKPQIVYQTFNKMNDNDILIYADSGCSLNVQGIQRLKEYIDIVNKDENANLSFELSYPELMYTKMELFEHLNCLNNDMIFSNQLLSGIFIIRKTERTCKLIKDWLLICENYNLIDDSISKQQMLFFKEHRHDQSVFSILRKIHGTYKINDETYFTNWNTNLKYPIHARRIRN